MDETIPYSDIERTVLNAEEIWVQVEEWLEKLDFENKRLQIQLDIARKLIRQTEKKINELGVDPTGCYIYIYYETYSWDVRMERVEVPTGEPIVGLRREYAFHVRTNRSYPLPYGSGIPILSTEPIVILAFAALLPQYMAKLTQWTQGTIAALPEIKTTPVRTKKKFLDAIKKFKEYF